MFKNKKVIIFDMDGTLIDSVGIWNQIDKKLLNELGCLEQITEADIQKQRDDKLREYSKLENPYMEYYNFLILKYGWNLTGEEVLMKRYAIAQYYLKNIVDYKDGVPELLKKLKENNYILIIASTTRRSNIEIYSNENVNIIEKANLNKYFSKIYTREDVKEIKPNPEIYTRILNEFNVSKDECLIFEDSLIGIEAAKNAEIEAVAIYDKYSDLEREEINKLADYKVDSYQEIINLL